MLSLPLLQGYVRMEGPEGLSVPGAAPDAPTTKEALMNLKKEALVALAKEKGIAPADADTKAIIVDAILAAAEHPAEE